MFTVLLKVATYNIVKGHNLLMHESCYVDIGQEDQNNYKYCGEAVRILRKIQVRDRAYC